MAVRCLAIALIVIISAAAASAAAPPLASDCLTPLLASSGKNLYPEQFRAAGIPATSQVTVAQHFAIQYFDTYKIVNNTTPYSEETYVLYQCGTLPPAAADIPKGAKVFQIPLSAVSVDDSTAVAYVKAIGVVNRVSYVTDTVIDACMQELSGPGCSKVSNVSSPLQGDAVAAFFTGGADSSTPNTIAVTGYTDPGFLNRFEWIKYIAAFFNQEAVANTVYNTTVANYQAIARSVAAIAPAVTSTERPLVAWLAYFPAYGPKYPPSWKLSTAQYKVDITQDAGGRMHTAGDLSKYVNANLSVTFSSSGLSMGNQTRAFEILHEILPNVDIVIDETGYVGVRDYDVTLTNFLNAFGLTQAGDGGLPFLKSQSLYRLDGVTNAGLLSDWYEGAYTAPDMVLLDFVSAITPAAATAGFQPRWVRNLATRKPTVITATQCTTLRGCALTATPLCPSIYQACDGSVVYATAQQPCAPVCTTTSPPVSAPPPPKLAAVSTFASPLLLSFMALAALLMSLALSI